MRAKWRSSLSAYSSALKKFLTRADIVRQAKEKTDKAAYQAGYRNDLGRCHCRLHNRTSQSVSVIFKDILHRFF